MEKREAPNKQTKQPFLSIVIPVFSEGAQLLKVLTAVHSSLSRCNLPYELVLVDDGSPDDTWRVIVGEANACQAIRALCLSRNFGKESALCAGLEHARGDAVIVMDADGQHPPALIPEMVRMWESSGADIVEAVKRRRGRESLSSKLGALLFYFILTNLSGFHFKGASDFKLMNRKTVDAWLKMRERNVFFRGMTVWMGFTTVQIPFEVAPRSAGNRLVYFKTPKTCSYRNDCLFVVPTAFGHICRCGFRGLVSHLGGGDFVPETGRASGQRFRHRHSLGANHWKFPNDQPRNHR